MRQQQHLLTGTLKDDLIKTYFPPSIYVPGDADLYTDATIEKTITITPADRPYNYQGTVIDSATSEAVPGATVSLLVAGVKITEAAADSAGQFSLFTALPVDLISISSVGYKAIDFPASTAQNIFELERSTVTLPPVILNPPPLPAVTKTNPAIWLGALALIILANQKKKAVGKINVSTLAVVGIGGAMLLGWSVVRKTLEGLNIFNGPGVKETIKEQADPGSPWKPVFWRQETPSLVIQESFVQDWISQIHDAFTVTNDDFNAVFNVFSQLKTQSQVSYLADKFQQKYQEDLLSFLKDGGGIMPWDGLSDGHLKILTSLVTNLPKYGI